LKRYLVTLLKIAVSGAIIAFLVWQATRPQEGQPNVFTTLKEQPKDWPLLIAAWLTCTAAVLLTFLRWWYLVRALELPFRLREALRLGFLGYLFNLAPMGIVGGDLLKAFVLARQYPQARARAVASVGVDRAIGFFVLFLVASGAILITGSYRLSVREIRLPSIIILALTGLGSLLLFALMRPGMTNGRLTRRVGRLRRVGPALESLIEAIRMYRHKPVVLAVSAAMSVGVHSLSVVGVYLIARGPPEFLLELFYTHMPGSHATIPTGQGLVVALAYRLITILIAAIGICYYLGSRRELAEVIQHAEQQSPGLQVSEAEKAI